MISKRSYLPFTAVLLMLSVGVGVTMQHKIRSNTSHRLAALQALQTAHLKLGQAGQAQPEHLKTQALIGEAIERLSASEKGQGWTESVSVH
ncbi:hypothetical protein [Vampirovibrio sp.]|uniref:hypothetical protein n=1 Tax=Vampirovibrio sp. TaxID=2717857 RepID=UPI0035943208